MATAAAERDPRPDRRASSRPGAVPGRRQPRRAPRASGIPWALGAVLALTAALRLYHLRAPFVDTSDWRQTDTASIAWFFFRYGIRLLHPQLWHDGPGPDYTQLELQITPALTAAAAHLFGYSDTLLRAVAAALDVASAVPLWALVRRRLGPAAALWTTLVYGLLPLGVYFGRTYQPEPAMLLTGNLALWAADRAGQRPRPLRVALAAALLALAVLAKLPNALLLAPAVVLALGARAGRAPIRAIAGLVRRRLGAVLAVTLTPLAAGAAFTAATARVAAGPDGSRYVDFLLRSLPSALVTGQADLLTFLRRDVLGLALTPAGALAAALGAWVLCRGRRGRQRWLWAWGLALLAYGLAVVRTIRLQYYLMPFLPWVAVLAGVGLAEVARPPSALGGGWRLLGRLRPAAAVLLSVSLMAGGLVRLQPYWVEYWPWYRLGRALARTLPPEAAVVVAGTANPTLFYYMRRHGWRLATVTPALVEADAAAGARYLVQAAPLGACAEDYLFARYPATWVQGAPVFALQARLPAPAVPARGPLAAGCGAALKPGPPSR